MLKNYVNYHIALQPTKLHTQNIYLSPHM